MDEFLPPFVPHATLHPAKPVTMGAFAMSDYFTEIMKAKERSAEKFQKSYSGSMGRVGENVWPAYKPVETYKAEDADISDADNGFDG